MLSVVMLSVVMLSVVWAIVVAPTMSTRDEKRILNRDKFKCWTSGAVFTTIYCIH
jgi:hypothetical protein